MTAYVPIESDTVGKNITLQIRRYTPTDPSSSTGCTSARRRAPWAPPSAFSCDAEIFVLVGNNLCRARRSASIRTSRPSDSPVGQLEHDDATTV